jgi:hypothetical protein
VVCVLFGLVLVCAGLARDPVSVWGLLGLLPLGVGLGGYSPLYHALGLSTARAGAGTRRPPRGAPAAAGRGTADG